MTAIEDAKAKKDKAKRGPKPKGDINKNVIKYDQGPTAENILRRLAREDQTELLDAIDRGELSVNAAASRVNLPQSRLSQRSPFPSVTAT
jgi:hypothetical protein